MLRFLDEFPLSVLIVIALGLGLAPFFPEPHIWEKLKMLADDTLTRPIDIFDLVFHLSPTALVLIKLIRMATRRA